MDAWSEWNKSPQSKSKNNNSTQVRAETLKMVRHKETAALEKQGGKRKTEEWRAVWNLQIEHKAMKFFFFCVLSDSIDKQEQAIKLSCWVDNVVGEFDLSWLCGQKKSSKEINAYG